MTKIKCWERGRHERDTYYHKKGRVVIQIEKDGVYRGMRKIKAVKTKSQALKFAKSYMKKHNKC